MSDLINPTLYRLLCRHFGEDEVEVVNPGVEILWQVVWRVKLGSTERKPVREIQKPGEEYRLRCRRCRDHRPRLYINHRWGVPDPETKSKNLWLAHCFNENCYAEYDTQRYLYDAVYSLGGRRPAAVRLHPGRAQQPDVLKNIDPPGPLIRMDQMVEQYPEHESVAYLVSRGFDPARLGKLWQVSYCPRSHFRNAADRIIIPIYQDGMLVGWQARYVGDNVNGMRFNDAKIPKYWTSPGYPRSLAAYNLERALQHRTVVIVEGTTDVWNVGPMALGLLGTTASSTIISRIGNAVRKTGATIIVALDPQPEKAAVRRNKPHAITRLCNDLLPLAEGRVVPLWLPMEYDPGSIDRRIFRRLAAEAAAKVGLEVGFDKHSLIST